MDIISDSISKSAQKLFEIEPPLTELCLSDIEFATKIELADTTGKFIKNGLRIIPNPQCIFGGRYFTLYAYTEIYNLNPANEYEVRYIIFDALGELVQELPSKVLSAGSKDVTEVIDIPVANFKRGAYLLKVEVTQAKRLEQAIATASKEKNFYVVKEVEEEEFELTDEELKYYDLIKYVASQKELEFYKSLPPEAKPIFLINFWEKAGKPLLHTLMDRVKYADANFSTTLELGRDSDMGRIWIRYGNPDEIERYPHDPTYHACQKWIYFTRGGIKFIFVDKSDYGRYELVHSSIPEEPTDPNYQKWVNPEVLE